MAIEFLLLGHVGQIDKSPGYDARPAIEEKLEVKPLANTGIELDPHHVVIEDVACELAVKHKKADDQCLLIPNVRQRVNTYEFISTHQSSEFVGKR